MAQRIGASVLALGVLAACQAAPPPFVPEAGAPSVAPSVPAQPAAVASASQAHEASTAPSPTVVPSPAPFVPAVGGCAKVVASGTVHDGAGAKLSGVQISVVSLDANQPYQATTLTSQGGYAFNNVPEGVLCRYTASLAGFASRSLVRAYQCSTNGRLLGDFGGDNAALWPDPALALTHQPEVAEVVASASGLRVRLSEPLNEANRARFAQALRLLPTRDPAASPAGGAQDFDLGSGLGTEAGDRLRWPFAWRPDPQATGPALAWPEGLPEGSLGASDASPIGAVAWNAAGDEALWTWGVAPPGADRPGVGHQLALVVGAQAVADGEGLAMGLPGVQAGLVLPAGKLLPLAFHQDPPATLPASELPLVASVSAERRWAWVHRHAWPLKLAP